MPLPSHCINVVPGRPKTFRSRELMSNSVTGRPSAGRMERWSVPLEPLICETPELASRPYGRACARADWSGGGGKDAIAARGGEGDLEHGVTGLEEARPGFLELRELERKIAPQRVRVLDRHHFVQSVQVLRLEVGKVELELIGPTGTLILFQEVIEADDARRRA